ncbi:hypothetical protein [Streptomyces sp. NPDC001717]|uniref:hypothetical protein n=1 Tax=Streptomyces sp. NPDC001717 TaxID=3364604 RepID=UPI003688C520
MTHPAPARKTDTYAVHLFFELRAGGLHVGAAPVPPGRARYLLRHGPSGAQAVVAEKPADPQAQQHPPPAQRAFAGHDGCLELTVTKYPPQPLSEILISMTSTMSPFSETEHGRTGLDLLRHRILLP